MFCVVLCVLCCCVLCVVVCCSVLLLFCCCCCALLWLLWLFLSHLQSGCFCQQAAGMNWHPETQGLNSKEEAEKCPSSSRKYHHIDS